jgi:hypothetical protein
MQTSPLRVAPQLVCYANARLGFLPRTAARPWRRPPRAPTKAVNLRSWIAAPPSVRPRGLYLDHRLPGEKARRSPKSDPLRGARPRAAALAPENGDETGDEEPAAPTAQTGFRRARAHGLLALGVERFGVCRAELRPRARTRRPEPVCPTRSSKPARCAADCSGTHRSREAGRRTAAIAEGSTRSGATAAKRRRSMNTASRAVGRGTTTVVQSYVFHRTSSFRMPALTLKDVSSSVKSRTPIVAARHRSACDAPRARLRTSLPTK